VGCNLERVHNRVADMRKELRRVGFATPAQTFGLQRPPRRGGGARPPPSPPPPPGASQASQRPSAAAAAAAGGGGASPDRDSPA